MAVDTTTHQIVAFLDQVTNQQYRIIMESCSFVWTGLSIIGIVSNIINVRTFAAMGLRDGITLSFFALSVFDLSYVVASLSLGISVTLYVKEMKSMIRFVIEPYGVAMFFANIMILLNLTNVLTTTFLAVARCMCVAKPLQFKNSFTRCKTICFIIAFAIFAVASYTPILANMGMSIKFDARMNISRPVLWVSPEREAIKDIVWVVIDMILPFTTQVIVLVCIMIMSSSLQAASKFRKSSALPSMEICDKDSRRDTSEKVARDCPGTTTRSSNKLSGKDLRVVQQVILISVVYIICNTPKILISIVGAVESEFTIGGGYHNLYLSVNSLRKHFEIFNASVNTVIYFIYNTKFRKMLCL